MGNQRVTGDLITRNFPERGTVDLGFCNVVDTAFCFVAGQLAGSVGSPGLSL